MKIVALFKIVNNKLKFLLASYIFFYLEKNNITME